MLLSHLPDDVLFRFVNDFTSLVCTRWYKLWLRKELIIDLKGGREINLKKYSNVIGLHLDKYNDLTSYISITTSINFTNLRILYLNNNHIIDDDVLGNLTKLNELSLRNNSVISDRSVEKLTN